MKRRKKLIILTTLVALAAGYFLTRGNAYWRIKSRYPTAMIYHDPANSPDPTLGGLLRGLGLKFFSGKEPIGFHISDSSEPIDLQTFKGMVMGHVRFTNCRFADISLLLTMYRPEVSFERCDLSAVPAEQKDCLSYSEQFGFYQINGLIMSERYPSGYKQNVGLHSYSFYP
jgi:hypothetical protein